MAHREMIDQRLTRWAAERGGLPAFTFVDYGTDPKGVPNTVTWAELDRWTRAMAARLAETTRPGARAAILAPQGLGYIVAFLGCLRAGVIAVPLFVPDARGHSARLTAVLGDCDPDVVLTTQQTHESVTRFVADHPVAKPRAVIAVDDLEWLDFLSGAGLTAPETAWQDVSYLQYTSGSTGVPSGAMITHANLAANTAQAVRAYHLDTGTTVVSWLPLFHDMGLVTAIGVPVTLGVHAVVLAPFSFIQRPARWLRLLSEYPNAFSAAPNFAYDHCTRRVSEAERSTVDLSRVHVLINGSEPVRASTIEDFTATFGQHGFPAEALRPSYGLAEATVLVSASRGTRVTAFAAEEFDAGTAVRDPRGSRVLVEAGRPVDQLVRIVDPDRHVELPAGEIGEIWLAGPNIAAGYWQRPDRSAETFAARLSSPSQDTPEQPWLRTGDLGFFHDGGLYVAGRIKDMIIVDGQNHYPQDIETTVERVHPAIRRDRVAAFGVSTDDSERVIVLAELERRTAAVDLSVLENAVRQAVTATHNVRLHDFLFVRSGVIPRTSSGKVQRAGCRTRYQAGELTTVTT